MASMEDALKEFLSKQNSPPAQGGLIGSGIGALGALINGNSVYDTQSDLASRYGQQADILRQQMASMPTLADMYGPNSAYAQQLQQTLARKDAAAGRNSQYGARAAQLQAMLADKGSQYAAQQAQSAQAYQQALNQAQQARANAVNAQAQIRAQQLSSLFDFANQTGLTGKINSSLSDYFGLSSGQGNASNAVTHSNTGYGDYMDLGPDSQTQTYNGPMSQTWDGGGATGLDSVPQATDAGTGGWADSDQPYQWY